jgi:UDP-N-acetyl-D-glucosamine dehydrogenase
MHTTATPAADNLVRRLADHTARPAVIGLGYVGQAAQRNARALFGMAYTPDVDDIRESAAIDVVRLLQRRGATVTFSDPHVSRVDDHGLTLEGVTRADAIAGGYDCAVITTNHTAFDYAATQTDRRAWSIPATR